MRAITEYLCDLLQNEVHFLTNQSDYNNFITQFQSFILELYETETRSPFIYRSLNRLNRMKGPPTKVKITSLIKLVQSFETLEIPMNQQTWYINKMNEIGYNVPIIGQCYGMAHMAVNAFLAEDYSTFIMRLKTIYKVSALDIKENLHSQATINPIYLDILAFFDALVVYQQPSNYPKLFDFPVVAQNAEVISTVVAPLYYTEQPRKKPTLIHTIAGSYNTRKLAESITLLEHYFRAHLFSILIVANKHALALHYHPDHHWILLDSNQLPGASYLRTNLLVEAIFKAFFITKINGQYQHSLLMTSYLYTQEQHKPYFMSQLTDLKNEYAWIRIHTPQKANLSMALNHVCQRDELSSIQDLLDQHICVTNRIFIACCQNGSISGANLLLQSGFHPMQPLIERITFGNKHCPLTWGKWLCTIGLIPPISLLKKALLEQANLAMADALIDMGIVLTDALLHDVCLLSPSPVPVLFLMEKGLMPDQSLLYKLCNIGHITHAQLLMEKGVMPTEPMLSIACQRQNYDMINLLIDWGVRLSFDSLEQVCNMNNTHLQALVMARDLELISFITLANSTNLDHVLHHEPHASIACSLGPKAHLSLLQHLKRNGTPLTYHSLTYACWANKTESISWLLKEGVVLPKRVFNQLSPLLGKNVLDLLNPTHQPPRRYIHQPYGTSRGPALFTLPNRLLMSNSTPTSIHSTFVMQGL